MTATTSDTESGSFEWVKFSGTLWGGAGGGPLVDESGGVIGIVQAVSKDRDSNFAVPMSAMVLRLRDSRARKGPFPSENG